MRGKENGDIDIPGFYDDVIPPTASEKAALAALPPVEGQLKRDLGLAQAATDQRLADSYFRPTLNVRSIHVGDAGLNAANALATSAFASIDFRLTPGETPERVRTLFDHYLESQGWFLVDAPPDLATRLAHPKIVMVKWDPGAALAVKSDMDSPPAKAAVAAIERVEGGPILKMPMAEFQFRHRLVRIPSSARRWPGSASPTMTTTSTPRTRTCAWALSGMGSSVHTALLSELKR